MVKIPIYLDNNATTQLDPRVLEAMMPYFTETFGNAASRNHSFGWKAEEGVDWARNTIAKYIGADEKEIVFTSGSTESNNLAIKGVAEMYASKGNHIITCTTEHKAVLDTCKALERKGSRVTYLTVNKEGFVNLDQLREAITDQTILVTIMHANNEIGVLQDIEAIGKICHEKGVLFHTDSTQSVGKVPFDVQRMNVDLASMSAHKIYGPKGVGALYVRRKNPRVTIIAQIDGGGHERNLRSGTLNVPGIVGFGMACELAAKNYWDESARQSVLRTRLEQGFTTGKVSVNGNMKNRLPNTTNLCFRGMNAQSLLNHVPDIALATGSACSSALPEPSHVLLSMGLSNEDAYSSIRFSLGKYTTEEEIDNTINKISHLIKGD